MGARLISESMFIGVSPLVGADSTPRFSMARRFARPRDRPAVPNFFGDASHRVSERQRAPLGRHSGSIRDTRLTAPEKSVKHNRRLSPQLSPIRYTSRRDWPRRFSETPAGATGGPLPAAVR